MLQPCPFIAEDEESEGLGGAGYHLAARPRKRDAERELKSSRRVFPSAVAIKLFFSRFQALTQQSSATLASLPRPRGLEMVIALRYRIEGFRSRDLGKGLARRVGAKKVLEKSPKTSTSKKNLSASRRFALSIAHSPPSLFSLPSPSTRLFPLFPLPRLPPTRTKAITAAESGRTSRKRSTEATTRLLHQRRRRRRKKNRRRQCSFMTPPPPPPAQTKAASPPPSSTQCPGRTSSGAARAGSSQICPPASKESSHPKLPEQPETALLPLRLPLLILLLRLHAAPSCRRRP